MFVNKSLLKWLTLTVCMCSVALSTASAQESTRTISFGLAKALEWDTSQHRTEMARHGLTDHSVIFYNLCDPDNVAKPYGWVQTEYLDRNISVVLTLIVDCTSTDVASASEGIAATGELRRIADGAYDGELTRLAKAIAEDGRPIVVRALHEGDGNWYKWGMYAEGNTVEDYTAAFGHIVRVFRSVDAPVKFELNLNRRDGKSPPGVLTDIEAWFPALDSVVDFYSISTYNRCMTNADTYQEWRSFTEEFEPAYTALAAKTSKPINVAEVATTDLCGPNLPWYMNMVGDIADEFPQVEMITFYFGTVPIGAASNDVVIVWGFPTDSQRQAFSRMINLWREHFAQQ